MNCSLYDFLHEDDHVKLYNILSTYHMQSSSMALDFERRKIYLTSLQFNLIKNNYRMLHRDNILVYKYWS
jgi:hypothetical protein